MCRYLAYLGEPLRLDHLIYRPANSLIHQAIDAMESATRINADGFGIGWYSPGTHPEPAVFKDLTPAWNNANLRSLAPTVASECIIAHVRAARRFDPVSRANCHPFQHGELLWMHNGDIPGRGRLHRRVVQQAEDALVARIMGSTDTELAFTLFLTRLSPPLDRSFSVAELSAAMRGTIRQLAAWHAEDRDTRPLVLNFCVTDGRKLVASRLARLAKEVPTLHYCVGGAFVCDGPVCRMESVSGRPRSVIVASERLSADRHWTTVEPDHLLVVHENLHIEVEPLSLAAG